jgi:predicted RNA methylase
MLYVEKVKRLAGSPPKNILELGAGGGQFAIAAAIEGYEVTAVELNFLAIRNVHQNWNHSLKEKITIIEGDFYQ